MRLSDSHIRVLCAFGRGGEGGRTWSLMRFVVISVGFSLSSCLWIMFGIVNEQSCFSHHFVVELCVIVLYFDNT